MTYDDGWLRSIPRRDLSLTHHALRMLLTHPMTTGDEARNCERLADAAWNESVARTDEAFLRGKSETREPVSVRVAAGHHTVSLTTQDGYELRPLTVSETYRLAQRLLEAYASLVL